ncbi:cytidylate kinase [Actinomadura sp. NBRC 104412]|uniref:(d)CMP kinase n=1 Tax=Actinomadura sp. NBRC 104412 TaxID=3032203 RepID=UPI00249FBD77|nr:(d)CMP kinase [Actinomadura sp. NBRC 104412]GLZ03748.1 cytidylate kinase [Actinomadura sp. NBRC 104412]
MPLVIAMDGPSGSGKSSVSKGVARALGLRYLDTGAMYRAMTWWMLRQGVPVEDAEAVAARAGEPVIEVGTDPDHPTITVDGTDVSKPIRTREVTNAVSAVSRVPEVRERLVALQRRIIGDGRIVVEGRDIGTVVAPDAPVKVFLTASEKIRAERRAKDLAAEPGATLEVTQAEQARRDRLDSTRTASPLLKAADAEEIDSSAMSLEEVVAAVVRLAESATETTAATRAEERTQ